MVQTNNPYEKLVDYFDKQIVKEKKPPAKELQPKKVQEVEQIDTKQIIEDSTFHSFIPASETNKKKQNLSEGFDIQKFESMMRVKLIEEHKKIQSYERPYISVTELCSCLRQCYYIRMKYPVNLNKQYQFSYLYLIQRIGNEIHAVIQELYGFSETEKTVVSNKYKVKGRIDGIRDSFLYEIKSIDLEKYKNEYIKEHYLQALIYAYILNTEYDYNLKNITIIYVMRNLKRIDSFDLPVDHKIAESLLSRALILKSCLDSTQIPDPIGAIKESCSFCLYKSQCEKDKCNEIIQPFIRKEKVKDVTPPKQKEESKSAFLL